MFMVDKTPVISATSRQRLRV